MTINSAQASPGGYRFRTVMAAATLIVLAASVAGCSKKVARTPDPRPVRTVTVESPADGETEESPDVAHQIDHFHRFF